MHQGCAELGRSLAFAVALRSLRAGRCGWDSGAVREVIASLATCVTLTALDVSHGRCVVMVLMHVVMVMGAPWPPSEFAAAGRVHGCVGAKALLIGLVAASA